MKKSKRFVFGLLKKGQMIFCMIVALLVVTSCIALDISSAKESNGKESLDFTVVIDAGHGGVDPGSIGTKPK